MGIGAGGGGLPHSFFWFFCSVSSSNKDVVLLSFPAYIERAHFYRARSASRRTSRLPVLCCGLLHPNFSAMACRGKNPNKHIG
jgi:hypothetical protein